jgi:hypothetical protein
MSFQTSHRRENISLFPACKPPPMALKANPETECYPFQKKSVLPFPARWRVEIFNQLNCRGFLSPWLKQGRRRATGCGSPRQGHKMQQV